MKETHILALCMIAAVISFLGFVVENVWLTATKGYIDNRNMCFPFLLGYGIAILLIYIILGTPKKLWLFGKVILIKNKLIKTLLYFLGVMICVSVGEIVIGTFVEKTCHFCWWDYTQLPLHITQYTSIPTSAMFSSLITFFMDYFFVPLFHYFSAWNYNTLHSVASILCAITIGDFLYNSYKMYKTNGPVIRWTRITKGSWLYRQLHEADS